MDQPNPPSSSSKPSPPAGVSPVPAPWLLKAKLYLFTKLLSPGNREDPVLQGLPPGSYSPSETVHSSALGPVNGAPQWKGGLCYVVLVRYEDSPVGPYDELIAVSDGWANPYEKRSSGRITNIYVSSLQSVWNGRNNWSMYHLSCLFFCSRPRDVDVARLSDIPKHLARFEFVPTESRTSTFKAFLPDEEKPFFAASITDSYLPGVPVPAFLLNPFMRIVQPPLVGTDADESTDDWVAITPNYRGRWRVAYIQPAEAGLEMYGDGLHYPQIKPSWIGAKFTGTIYFPIGEKFNKNG
jgi:hypothetical protein